MCPRVLFSDPYFLTYINDPSSTVSSQVRLFADDLSPISHDKMSVRSGETAERPICVTGLGRSMGNVLQPLGNLKFQYTLKGETLGNVSSTPYLGVCLSETLEWEAHINKITSKANSTLGFLRRNLKACHPKLRETAYFSLVRSYVEYSSAVWDPFRQKDIDKLEKNQKSSSKICHPKS